MARAVERGAAGLLQGRGVAGVQVLKVIVVVVQRHLRQLRLAPLQAVPGTAGRLRRAADGKEVEFCYLPVREYCGCISVVPCVPTSA